MFEQDRWTKGAAEERRQARRGSVLCQKPIIGLQPAVVNPRQARDVAKATGTVAKTDALEVRFLTHVAEAVRPIPRPQPDAQA